MNEFEPDYASPPADTLRETFAALKLTVTDLVLFGGVGEGHAQQLWHGEAPITPDVARVLDNLTGVPWTFWLNRQRQYDETLARLERAAAIQPNLFKED